ncbi:MAG: ABC transporter substrate-binding protein [Ancalomicrobiaceae bacterium]|nr:ABC transporter substrate-binding protein [Ancalomicrobiaceae bacterium]
MAYKTLLAAGVAVAAVALAMTPASAKELKTIGMSVGSLSNPYFLALIEGATNAAKQINPNAKVTAVSSEYDIGKQFGQMDNFIAAGVDLILVAADDPHAIAPAIKRAQDAGIPVVAVDVEAEGADATIETDNYQAGLVSCAYLGEKMGGTGDVVMQWVGPLSGSIARIKGCHDALAKYPAIKVLSDNENSGCTREGGLKFTLGDLQRFPTLKGMYTICEPEALGANLAIKQLGRSGIVITSTDGSPDAADALKTDTALIATSSQDPRREGMLGVQEGYGIMNGKQPEQKVLKLAPGLVTRDNVKDYKGW